MISQYFISAKLLVNGYKQIAIFSRWYTCNGTSVHVVRFLFQQSTLTYYEKVDTNRSRYLVWDTKLLNFLSQCFSKRHWYAMGGMVGFEIKGRSQSFSFWINFFQIWDTALNFNIMKFHCNFWYSNQSRFWNFPTFWNDRTWNFTIVS